MVTLHYRDNLVRKETTRGVTLLKHFNLYHKFALTMILLGLLPMLLLATFIANKMIRDYSRALSAQYDQASEYVLSSMESVFDNYNTISKMPYFYNMGVGNGADSYLSFDHFRKILTGEEYEAESMETDRQRDMQGFLQPTVRTIWSVTSPLSTMSSTSKSVISRMTSFALSAS